MIPRHELVSRLTAAAEDSALSAIGFHDDDRVDTQAAIAEAVRDDGLLDSIGILAERVRAVIGEFDGDADPLDHELARSQWRGIGVLPMLALLAVSDDVRAFHRFRGVPPEVSDSSLSDLGQQVAVHRRTYGAFGVDTYRWLVTAFSGDLYWLGRLQFNLVRWEDQWVLSTHIPETGPLTPESVDDSFARAAAFFAEHFPDYPTRLFYCGSWLLDPHLGEVLRPESNMVRFQRRWTPHREIGPGDSDAIYFVFRRRGEVDRATLPRDTSLQRAILDRMDAGGHWAIWSGTSEQSPYRSQLGPATGREGVHE